MTQPTTPTRADKQFSTKGLHLLKEGRYKEWFYLGLDPVSLRFVKAPVKDPTPPPPEPIYKKKEFPQVKGWRDEAGCRDADPRIFFVEGEGVDPKREYMDPNAEWRSYCPQCPVRETCLELARESASVGIFGGKLFRHRNGGSGSAFDQVEEFDETNMPKTGRPSISPRNVKRRAETSRKKVNARISTTSTC
jgi:hypothetical protein